MRQVIAFAIAAVAAIAAGCTNDTGVTCPPGQTLCGEVCVYTTSDPKNCGTCGNICGGDLECIGGVCGCPTGQAACNNMCVDVKSDANNCGACGTVCPSPEVCSMSACAGSCATGLTNCNRDCVNLTSDDNNCGACGTACGSGLHCKDSICVQECPNGQVSCGGKCVSLLSDSGNCGTCGNACPNDYFCIFGSCILGCPKPLTRCVADGGESDGGTQCVDTRDDPRNCGGCGGSEASPSPAPNQASLFLPHVCTATAGFNDNPVCDDGRCTWTCQPGMGVCAGGEQGPPRGPAKRLNASAKGLPPPPPGQAQELQCFDFVSDNCNCGGCGNNCSNNYNDAVDDDGDWDTDNESGQCMFDSDELPNATNICCDGSCTDIGAPQSCGSCAAQQNCSDVFPSASPLCCPNLPFNFDTDQQPTSYSCKNAETDFTNCGGCGNDCTMVPTPSVGTVTCCPNSDNKCQVIDAVDSCGGCFTAPSNCPEVFSNPSSAPAPACCPIPSAGPNNNSCADLNHDTQNCGACGTTCAAPAPSTEPACCPGIGCTDLETDNNNCGTCGRVCTVFCDNPSSVCSGGGCTDCD